MSPAGHDFVRFDGSPDPAAGAQQDEIQVYTDDINKRGEFGLELHLNTTPQGKTTPDYPGEITNHHGFRFTPEFSYGLTSDVELGLYLPMLIDGGGDYHFVGVKYRLKWLPVRPKDERRRMVPRRQQRTIEGWLQVL